MPQRGCASAKRDERGDRIRLGDRVRVRDEDVLARRRRDAEVDVRGERKRARVLEHADAAGTSSTEPGTFATTSVSSTCGTSAGSERSSSAACPCETTTAETFTSEYLPVDGERLLGGRAPAERARALETRRDEALAIGERLADAVCELSSSTKTAASPATSTSAGSGTATTGVPEAIASSTGRPKPSNARAARGRPRRGRARPAAPSRRSPRAARRGGGARRRARVLLRPGDDERQADRRRGVERGELVLPSLDRADREHVVTDRDPGAKAGSTPFGVTTMRGAGTP